MLEFLFEPMIDFVVYNTGQPTHFGCPDSCVEPHGQVHQLLKLIFTPIILLGLSIGVTFGVLFAFGKLRRFALKDPMKKMIEKSAKQSKKTKEPKSIKELEHAIRKEKKQEFLDLNDDLKEDPFEKFVQMQSPDHPLTDNLEAVRTEAKEQEIQVPEQKLIEDQAKKEQIELEEQAKKVAKLMEDEGITEDEAVERILTEDSPKFIEAEEDILEKDIFSQDRGEPKFKSKALVKLQKHFQKKEKPKFKWILNDLGKLRRDQYAQQIESKLNTWAFPLPKYSGKNQEEQKDDEVVKSDLKKLALFLSMGELMKDKHRKKRMYWEKIKVATQ